MSTSPVPIIRRRGDIVLMTEQYEELKKDMSEIKDRLAHLITMHEVGKRDHENLDQTIRRAFRRLEKLESRVDDIKETTDTKVDMIKERQLSNMWISHVATACLTGLGMALAGIVVYYGGKI